MLKSTSSYLSTDLGNLKKNNVKTSESITPNNPMDYCGLLTKGQANWH